MLMSFLSSHCILSLVLNVWNQEKNKRCMANFLSPICHISAHFNNINIKLSKMPILRCIFIPCCQSMKIPKIDFYGTITNKLYRIRYDHDN